jgi:hypothetical protein
MPFASARCEAALAELGFDRDHGIAPGREKLDLRLVGTLVQHALGDFDLEGPDTLRLRGIAHWDARSVEQLPRNVLVVPTAARSRRTGRPRKP